MTAKPRVLVAIPCFDEETAIPGIVMRAREHAPDVVVVDDGSSDRTAKFARMAGALVLQHESNHGKGAAVRTAFRHAAANGFDVLVLLDGDGQHDPDDIPRLLEPILRSENPTDMVLGDRKGRTDMPSYRRAGKAILDVATTVAAGTGMVDSQCGFRAFNRTAIDVLAKQLSSRGFEVESEMLVLAETNRLRMASVSIRIRYEGLETSTANPIVHGARVLDRVVYFLALRRPMMTLGLPGIMSVVFGAYWGIRMLRVYQQDRIFVTSYGLGAATFTLFGGILIATALMLSVIGLVRTTSDSRVRSASLK